MTPQEIFKKELLTYDKSAQCNVSFYYNLPYIRDYDISNWSRLYSGNVIKFYQYQLGKPVVIFTDTENM